MNVKQKESKELEKNMEVQKTKILALCSFYCDEIQDEICEMKSAEFNNLMEIFRKLEIEQAEEMHACFDDEKSHNGGGVDDNSDDDAYGD